MRMALVETQSGEVTSIGEAERPKIKPLIASYAAVSKAIEPLCKIDKDLRSFWGDSFSDVFGNKLAVLNNYEYSTNDGIVRSVAALFENEGLITALRNKIGVV